MRLKGSRYEEINREIVEFLEDHGITRYPVDVFCIARRMQIALCPYSQLSGIQQEKAVCYSVNGFTIKNADYSDTRIYYNDRHPIGRIRYTIAHELAHIVLEHGPCDGNEELESEADYFAAYLLMPVPLVLALCTLDPDVVSEFFVTSHKSATYAVKRAVARLTCGIPPQDYEIQLIQSILGAMKGGGEIGG